MSTNKLRDFVVAMTELANSAPMGGDLMEQARPLLADLIRNDDWLPEECAVPHDIYYRQYLLHCDPAERFSLVSFVWGPGQQTPIHNHTVWGLIGMLRGEEISTPYEVGEGRCAPSGDPVHLKPGHIDAVAPEIGDIHKVVNAFDDQVSISIHLYGANIGAVSRNVFDPATGAAKTFISGYNNAHVPNIWDRSKQAA